MTKDGEKLAPAVRRLVEEHKLDAGGIAGSGRDGRITKGDVLTHLSGRDSAPAAPPAPAAPVAAPPRLRAVSAARRLACASGACR